MNTFRFAVVGVLVFLGCSTVYHWTDNPLYLAVGSIVALMLLVTAFITPFIFKPPKPQQYERGYLIRDRRGHSLTVGLDAFKKAIRTGDYDYNVVEQLDAGNLQVPVGQQYKDERLN